MSYEDRMQMLMARSAIAAKPMAIDPSQMPPTSQRLQQALVQEIRTGVPAPAPTPLELKVGVAKSEQAEFIQWAEIRRIIGLRVIEPMDQYEMEAYSHANVLASAFAQGFRLRPMQCMSGMAYELEDGLFAPIGVGGGKTLTSLLIAGKALCDRGMKRVTLHVPSHVLSQLVDVDLRWARARIPMNFPIHVLGGCGSKQRMAIAKSGNKGLYIFPYSLMSRPDTSELFRWIAPELCICDEVHLLARPSAARSRRFETMADEFKVQMCAMSGTITQKSVADYWHIIHRCLPRTNPLPNSHSLAMEFGEVIDSESASQGDSSIENSGHRAGALVPLIEWAKIKFPQEKFPENIAGFRYAFRKRLRTAPGVVSGADDQIGTSLCISRWPVPGHRNHPDWPKLEELIKLVDETMTTPTGDVIDHAMHTWKWLYELSAGFYNELYWTPVEKYAERKKISPQQAADILMKAKEYHQSGQLYHNELRKFLMEKHRPGLDTPFLVGNNMRLHQDRDVPHDLYLLWKDWRNQDFPGRPDRDSRAVRVCSYKVDAAVQWGMEVAKDGDGGLIWVYNEELGEWITEAMMAKGLPAMHCPAGNQHNDAIRDPKNARRLVVASITAHGEGKNLQHFHRQIYCQWPRPAKVAEQSLGRTHRYGQKADEIIAHTLNETMFDKMNFAACLLDALYIHQTTGNNQKVITCNYDPMPAIFPQTVLHERGFGNFMLSAEMEANFRDRFQVA